MRAPGVDLLVVDHRTPRELTKMLASIPDAAAGHDVAVWIGLVDSVPESDEIARAFLADTGIPGRVVKWVDNVGYNRALNLLGTLGTHPIIGCCNADIIFSPESVSQLAWATDSHPDWGVVGPRQVGQDGRVRAGGIFGTETKPRHRGWKALHGHDDVRDDAVYVAGSALFLRRDVWDELTACQQYRSLCSEPGPWLDVQHFYGDSWISTHARAHGYRAVFYGTTTIVHKVGKEALRDTARNKADRERFRQAADVHGVPHE